MTRNIIAIALAAACLPAAAPAAAQDGELRIAVPTAGLDLASAEGRRALAIRADTASYGVCGPVLTYHRSHEAIAEGCRAEVRARAKAAAKRRALAPAYRVSGR